MPRRSLAAMLAAIATLALPAAAPALPGDQPITALGPAAAATTTAGNGLIRVTYACPVYRQVDAGDGFAFFGTWSDYGVALATSDKTGADGRLVDVVARDTGHQPSTLPAEQCQGDLGTGRAEGPENTPGTYFWQAFRLCGGCAGGYEAGEIRSVVVRADATLAVGSPGKVYAGYPFVLPLRLTGLADATGVTVQRRVGARWRRIAGATAAQGAGEAIASLPAGRHTVRLSVTTGDQALTSPAATITVRSANAARTRVRTGAWKGPGATTFTVAAGGAQIRGFTTTVTGLCAAVALPGGQGQTTTRAIVTGFARARIALDGRFVAAGTNRGTAYVVRGTLRGARLTGGRVQASGGGCTGSQTFRATRRG